MVRIDEKKLETGLLVTIFALIIIQVLFQSGTSFFPNWTSIGFTSNASLQNTAVTLPSIIPVVMPFLVLILFVFLVLTQVKQARGSGTRR